MNFRFKPGFITEQTAAKLNELAAMVDRLRPLAVRQDVKPPEFERFPAKITAVDGSGNYSWTEQFFTPSAGYEDRVNGRTGTPTDKPARERNGGVATSFPFFADLRRRVVVGGVPVYEFDLSGMTAPGGGGGSITVEEETPGITVTCDTLKFPNTSIVDNGGGSVSVQEASAAAAGMVSLSDQTMGDGVKTFKDDVIVGGGSPITNLADLYLWGQLYANIDHSTTGPPVDFPNLIIQGGVTSTGYDETVTCLSSFHDSSGNVAWYTEAISTPTATGLRDIGRSVLNLNPLSGVIEFDVSGVMPSFGVPVVRYSINGTPGATGTILYGATASGGIVTALGSATIDGGTW